jgi:hypothetical protein
VQVSAIPSGPTYYQPIQAVRPPTPVARDETDADGNTQKVRSTPPAGAGSLLDIQV